jgi:hypothetical protein
MDLNRLNSLNEPMPATSNIRASAINRPDNIHNSFATQFSSRLTSRHYSPGAEMSTKRTDMCQRHEIQFPT